MLRRLRENGPIILVPLAWTFVTAVHLDLASEHALFIAHLVMAVIIVVFTALSWSAMDRGVLLAWRRVLLGGLVVTLAGGVGFFVPAVATPLFTLSLVGWMLIPAAGLAYTAHHVAETPQIYRLGAVLSVLGLLVYAGSWAGGGTGVMVAGLTLVNAGQTAGIATAVYQY